MNHEYPSRGTAGGQQAAQKTTGAVSAAAFEKYLHGIHFPQKRQGILEYLRKNNATEDICNIANKFEDREYHSAADVAQEFGRVKRKGQ